MTRLKDLIARLKLSWKVFLLTFLLVESVILILGYTYYARSSDLLVRSQQQYAEQAVKKSDEYLQTNLKYIQGFFLSIASDARLYNDTPERLQRWLSENLVYYIPNAQHLHLLELSEGAGGALNGRANGGAASYGTTEGTPGEALSAGTASRAQSGGTTGSAPDGRMTGETAARTTQGSSPSVGAAGRAAAISQGSSPNVGTSERADAAIAPGRSPGIGTSERADGAIAPGGTSWRVLSSTSPYAWFLLEDAAFLERISAMAEGDQLSWLGPYYSPVSELTLTAALRLTPPAPGLPPRILLLDLSLGKLYAALFADRPAGLQGSLLLLGPGDELVYGAPPLAEYDVFERKYRFSRQGQAILSADGRRASPDDQWLVSSRSNALGWQVLMVVNQQELLLPLRKLNWFVWLLGAVSCLLAVGVAYAIAVLVSKPIAAIAALMNRMDLTRLDERIEVRRRDELGALGLHFNRMAQRISDLIRELKASEAQKKQADFLAMQSQIRPHFLLNTLHAIGLEAEYGHTAKVRRLIGSLTGQLQYILHSTPQPVALQEELLATERYVGLMMARYENAFELELDIDPATLGCLVPKFILQPLVENSIFHGLVPREGVGTLFINTSSAGEAWEILIEDDGVGMTPEQLAALRRKLGNGDPPHAREAADERTEGASQAVQGVQGVQDLQNDQDLQDDQDLQSVQGVQGEDTAQANAAPAVSVSRRRDGRGGIGLVNVHERFKLMFGDAYALTIESGRGEGTQIRIRLPRKELDA